MLKNTCQLESRILGRFASPRFLGYSITDAIAILGKSRKSFTVPSLVVLLMLTCGLQAQTLSCPTYSEWRISPASITVEQGSYTGSVSALNTKDQTGTQNTASLYVQFGTTT